MLEREQHMLKREEASALEIDIDIEEEKQSGEDSEDY